MGTKRDINDYIGDVAINFQGYEMTIVDARNTHDIDVRFNDDFNTIYQHKKLTDFYRGKIKNPNYLLGLESIATNGMKMKIVGGNAMDLIVEFEDGTIVQGDLRLPNFKIGKIRNQNVETFFGVAKMGFGYNSVSNPIEFRMWSSMLERCYCDKTKGKHQSYILCRTSDYFNNFQNFVEWYKINKWECDNQLVLDKDILFKGNKLYSEDTCVLVDRKINNLFTKSNASRGSFPIGVSIKNGKYDSHMSMNVEGEKRSIWLGSFSTPEDAFYAYKQAKESYIKQVANEYKSKYPNFPQKLYDAMYSYEVEITD